MEKRSVVSVIGLARSGMAVAKLLAEEGRHVIASDIAVTDETKDAKRVLEGLGVEVRLGVHPRAGLAASDFVVVSPGVPEDSDVMTSLVKDGKSIWSEIEVASRFATAHIAAVTGTNGKTTTVEMLGRIAGEAGLDVRVCGNVGNPMSAVCRDLGPGGWLIVEVSSYQLHHVRDFHPAVAAILNVSPDHLDRYDSYRSYLEDKGRILSNMKEDDTLVFPSGDADVMSLLAGYGGMRIPYTLAGSGEGVCLEGDRIVWRWGRKSTTLFHRDDISLIGDHNLLNAMAAAGMALRMGVPPDAIRRGLRGFAGLEHRLEDMGTFRGVRFINDSKSTNPASLRVALESFRTKVVLIVGGKEKGLDYSGLRDLIAERVEHLIAMGECGGRIVSEVLGRVGSHTALTMRDAVAKAFELAGSGDTVLFSPGTSSFDRYRDYIERGNDFKDEVSRLREEVCS